MSDNYLANLYKKGEEKKMDNTRKAKSQEELNQALRENLAHDSDLIRDAIKEEIINPLAINVISRSDTNDEKRVPIFGILSNEKLFSLDYRSNMKLRTFFFGFWDGEKTCYSNEKFTQAGKDLMLDELNKVIKPLKIVDISDPSLSKKYVLELIIPPNPEYPIIEKDGFEKDEIKKDEANDKKKTEEKKTDKNDAGCSSGCSSDPVERNAKATATDATYVAEEDGFVAVVKRGKKKAAK